MLNKNNIKLSVYDYLSKYVFHNEFHRGVGVITNKQMIFYSQIEDDDLDHIGIARKLEENIYQIDSVLAWLDDYKNDAFIFSTGDTLSIDLPTNGTLSKTQITFLNDILDQVEKINSQVTDERKKIPVDLFCYDNNHKSKQFDSFDFDAMRKAFREIETPLFYLKKEEIIGKTLSEDKILDNIQKELGINKCRRSSELVRVKNVINIFQNDDYFKKYIDKLLPNGERICELIDILSRFDVDIRELSINNLEESLIEMVHNIFVNLPKDRFINFMNSLNFDEKIKSLMNEYFPYFNDLVYIVTNGNGFFWNYNQEDIPDIIPSYDDLLGLMVKRSQRVLEEKEQNYQLYEEEYQKSKQVAMIQSRKDEIDKLISKYQELNNGRRALLNDLSPIYEHLNNVNLSSIKREYFLKKMNILNAKLSVFDESMKTIEKTFIDLTGLDNLYLNEELMGYVYQKTFDAEEIQRRLESLEKEITKLQDLIEKLGLKEEEEIGNKSL